MKDKTIMVTGGTGSFGWEFVKQILKYNPKAVRVYSRGEDLQQQMRIAFNDDPKLRFMIGDVRDRDRLSKLMAGCDIVIHAAALKQIPTCEYNPGEAIKTNIDGSLNVVDCAISSGVDRVLAISSDKAVQPINIYGATKLVMEKLFIQANTYTQTKFSCVRLGNIWGSRGSVLPLWERQRQTGTITLTEEEMSRFWITQEDAVSFAIKCLFVMTGGEVLVPKMSEKNMKQVAKEFAPDCEIKIVGRRAGEKVKEKLFADGETPELVDGYYIIRY